MACWFRKSRSHNVLKSRTGCRRIGIVLPNWIGDVVMATPALRALRRHFGRQSRLFGIMSPTAAEVLAGTDFLDEMVCYNRQRRAKGLFLVAAELRRLRIDTLILLTNSFSSALSGWLARTGERIGYARYARGPLLTKRLAPPRTRGRLAPVSAVDYYLSLARAVGCPVESPRLELVASPADRAAAEHVFDRLSIDSSRPLVTLNNGGGYGAAKKWPLRQVIGLAQRLAGESEASVLVVGGPAEQSDLEAIERETPSDRIHTLAGVAPTIGLTKACVQRSHVLVSTDSGVRHFAAAFGVPCITLFGPTDPRWSVNYHPDEQWLQLGVRCAPCGRRTCPLGHHRCLKELSVDQVFRSVIKHLSAPLASDVSKTRSKLAPAVGDHVA